MFLIKRLSGVFIVTFGVLLLTFLLIHWVPGDPVAVMLGESASSADVAALRIALGLDQPLLQQFGTYLYKLAHADFGVSIHTQMPIIDLLRSRYPATLQLAVLALLIGMLVEFRWGYIVHSKLGNGRIF